jgi:hypothetical protein
MMPVTIALMEIFAVVEPMEETVVEERTTLIAFGYIIYPVGTRLSRTCGADKERFEVKVAAVVAKVALPTVIFVPDEPPVTSEVILP